MVKAYFALIVHVITLLILLFAVPRQTYAGQTKNFDYGYWYLIFVITLGSFGWFIIING